MKRNMSSSNEYDSMDSIDNESSIDFLTCHTRARNPIRKPLTHGGGASVPHARTSRADKSSSFVHIFAFSHFTSNSSNMPSKSDSNLLTFVK
jgi:hypothetical protein